MVRVISLGYMKQMHCGTESKTSNLLPWKLRKQQAEVTIYNIKDPLKKHEKTTELKGIQKAFVIYYKSSHTQSDKADGSTIQTFLDSLDLLSNNKNQNEKLYKLNLTDIY